MNSKPLVSVCVALYNNARYIERCLLSIQKQTYTNIQIIVVNDGSTDKSEEVVTKFLYDSRFSLINTINAGLSSARQIGFDNALGEFICFIDADDFLIDSYIEDFLIEMEKNKLDVCVCGTVFQDSNKQNLEFMTKSYSYQKKIAPIKLTFDLLEQNFSRYTDFFRASDSWNKMYRTDFLKKSGVFFSHSKGMNGSDLKFNYIVLLHCPKISVITSQNYVHVLYTNSAVHKKKNNLQKSIEIIYERLFEECEKLGIEKKMHKQLSFSYVRLIRYVLFDVFKFSSNKLSDLNENIILFKKYCKYRNVAVEIRKDDSASMKIFICLLKTKNIFVLYLYFFIRSIAFSCKKII